MSAENWKRILKEIKKSGGWKEKLDSTFFPGWQRKSTYADAEEVYRYFLPRVINELHGKVGTPKEVSEFLARAGIDGVKYPVNSYGKTVKDGDKAGWNYVSFRDDNIRVDHKWVDGAQRFSISTRAYNPDARVLVVDGRDEPEFQNLSTAEIRNYIKAKYRNVKIEIYSDGTPVLFTTKGLESALKKRGKHKRVLHVLDELVKHSHYTRFEPNDGQEKHLRLDGQLVYTAAIRLKDGVYSVELKLDIPTSSPDNPLFKGQTLKNKNCGCRAVRKSRQWRGAYQRL